MTTKENIEALFELLEWAKAKQKYRGKRSGEYQNGIEASILMLQDKFEYIKDCDAEHTIPELKK